MAQTNVQLPTTVIPNTTPGIDWLTPNNILLANDQFAVSGGSSQILTVGNFPINLVQGDTVTNIVVGVKGYRGSFNTTLQIFAVDNTTGIEVSYPLLPAFQGFDGTNTLYLMPATLFSTTWSVNQINNIKIKLIADGELHLDYVQLNVVYTPVSTETLFYSSLAGLFLPGDTVTGFTSGATATVVADNGVDEMNITNVSGVFQLGETISGVPSGAVAIVASQFVSGSVVVDEFVQAQPFQLAQSMTSTDLFMFVNSFNYPNGDPIQYADFYGDAMLVIDQGVPNKEENVQITAVDQNFQGTGLCRLSFSNLSNRGLRFQYPYTTDATLRQDHSGTAEVVISNNAPFYNRFLKRSQIDALVSAPITVQDEGSNLTTALHTLNFVGSGVTATLVSPNVIRVNIPGGGGGGITLQTNGVANGDQTLLNLVAGTNMTITDNGTGSVTFDATGGGGGGGSEVTFTVTQAAHGLSVGDVIKSSGSAGAYAKAQADSAAHAEVVGIVTVVTDVNTFTYAKDAIQYGGAGIPAGTPGVAIFLDPTTPGAMTTTEPTTAGQISKPVGVLITSASKMNFTADYRGQDIQAIPITGGDCVTLIPQPNFQTAGTITGKVNNSNTIATTGQVTFPLSITINKISINVSAVGTSGTLKLALYSEDGQNKLFEVTTASISGTGVVTTSLTSPVIVPSGNYYILAIPQSTAALTISSWTTVTTVSGPFAVSLKPVLEGQITVSANTMPATFDPASDLSGSTNCTSYIRLDN